MPNIGSDIQDLYQQWLSGPTPALCVRLAGKLRHSDRNTEALKVARNGLTSWPDNISVNVIFGRCALSDKLLEEALEAFERVISIDPLNLIAIRSLAEIHFGNKSWKRCTELCEEYLFEYPGDPEIEEMLKKSRIKAKESAAEAKITGQDVSYPKTGRMASILAAQKKGSGNNNDSSSAMPESPKKTETNSVSDKSKNRSARSLFNLFSEEECEELGLSAYDK